MFGVTKILGYSQDVTKKITDDIDVKNITDNNIKLTVTKSSNIKSLLSNLIK